MKESLTNKRKHRRIGASPFLLMLFIVAGLISSVTGSAQTVGSYIFSQSAGTYVPITGGNTLVTGAFDNQVSGAITIPSFNFAGTNYTSLYISANGFITFGSAPTGTNYTPLSNTASYTGAISAFSGDLGYSSVPAGVSPEVRYELVGNEFVIQWQDVRRWGITGDRISAQIRLNTTTNEISIVYGGTITAGSNTTYPQVGLRGPNNTYPTNINNRTIASTGGAWLNSANGTANSSTMYFNSANAATIPAAGTTFKWTVPPPCVAPVAQPTALVLTPTSTSIGGSFTAAAPAADGYLVVRTTGAAPTNPTNGTTYTTGTGLGGTIVYVGTGTTFNNTGLTGNTSYTYYVFPYNNNCSGGPTYNTTSPLTGTAITCPAVPGSITVPTSSQSSFSLAWSSSLGGNASPVTYTVDVATDNAFANPVAGSPFTVNDPTVTQVVGGLTPTTTYYYRIKANGSCSSAYSSTASFTTPCAPITTLPWTENFDALATVGATSFPSCWVKQNGEWRSANASSTIYDSDSRSTPNYIQNNYTATNEFIWTPMFQLTAGVSYDFSFWYIGYTGLTGWTGDVFVNTTQSGTGATQVGTSFITATQAEPTTYTKVTRTFVPSTTGDYAFAIRINANSNPWWLSFDDFSLMVTPTCFPPTSVTLDDVLPNSAIISWAVPSQGSSPANYIWRVVPNGAGISTPAIDSGVVAAPALTAAVSGLSDNTTYNFYIQSDCGGGDLSEWTNAFTFTTPCLAANIPYTMPISSITVPNLPACVSRTDNNGDGYTWRSFGTISGLTGWTFPVLGYAYHPTNNANDWLFTQGLNLTAGVNYVLKFKYNNDGTGLYPEKLKVMYGTSANAAGMTNLLADYPHIAYDTPQMAYITFTPGASDVYYIGFHAYSDSDKDLLILNDISVELAPTCVQPTNAAVSNINAPQATLTWAEPTIGGPLNYVWKVVAAGAGASGTAISEGVVPAPATSTVIGGLTANTNYDVYVRSECGAGDSSAWISTSFNTNGYCTPAPTSVDNDGIIRVVMGTIDNPSGDEPGHYGDYSHLVTNVVVGTPTPVNITYGTGYTYGTIIWVDLNNNTVFENSEILYYGLSSGTNPTTLAASITLPLGTPLGQLYRVRIGGTDNNDGPSGPCYTGPYGVFEDYTIRAIDIPNTPTSLTQSSITPNCVGGTSLHALPAAPANVTYYLQTSATDTSTVIPFVGDSVVVNTNGTYYVRAKNQYDMWSTGAASIVVTNIPVAPLPPSPVADQSPACLTTDITVPAPVDPNVTYYWQGTNQTGTSNAQNASTPLTVTASGTYYVAAYDASSNCWSNTNGVAVVINTLVPPTPTVTPVAANLCLGNSLAITANNPFTSTLYSENFEGTLSMTTANTSTGITPAAANWTIRPDGYSVSSETFHSPDNSHFIMSNSDAIGSGAVTNTILTTPNINVAGYNTLSLGFDQYIRYFSSATPNHKVQVSTDNGSNWTTVVNYTSAVGSPASFVHQTINLNSYLTTGTVKIRFEYTGGWSYYWLIDNVSLTGTPDVEFAWAAAPSADAGLPIAATTPNVTNNTVNVTPTSNGTYTYTVVANVGACNSPSSISTVTVNPLPTVDAGATQTDICPGTPVTLNGSGAVSYTWDNGVTDGTPFYAPNTSTLYTVTGTDANGCQNTDTVSVFVLPTTPVSISPAGPITFCENQPVTLTANGPALGAPTTITQWDFNAEDLTPNVGTGTATVIGGVSSAFASGSGSSDPIQAGRAWQTSAYPAGGANPKTAGVQFNVNTTGYQNISFKYDVRPTNTAANKYVVQYNPDVTNALAPWITVQTFTYNAGGNFINNQTVDLSTYPAANNNPNLGLRIVADTSTGGVYVGVAGTYSGTGGNVRYDMVTLSGQPQAATYSWTGGSTSQSIVPPTPGTYVVTVTEPGVCPGKDSVSVTINPIYVENVNATICGNQTYPIFGVGPVNTTGIYVENRTSVLGCDSTVTVNLTVYPVYDTTVNVTICSNENYTLANGDVVNTAGQHVRTVSSVNNCDSVVTVNLTVIPAQSTPVAASICAGDVYTFPNGDTSSVAMVHNSVFQGANSCDSIVVTTLTIKPVYTTTLNPVICVGDTYTMPDGSQESTTDVYVFPYTATNGCDSSITVNLTVNPTYTTNIDVDLCPGETYTMVDGLVVSTAGAHTAVTTTVNGCDSTVIATITLRSNYNTPVTASICQGETYTLVNGTPVSANGVYTAGTQSIYGCDSVVTVTLTVNPVYNQTQAVSICQGETYTLPDGTPVTTPNTYTTTLPSSQGCDSTIVTTLTVNPLPNVNLGADIVVPNPPVTLNAGVGFTSYLWNDGSSGVTLLVTQNGTYSVTVTNQFGCEASDEINVNFTASIVNLGENGGSISLFPNPASDRFAVNVYGYEGGGSMRFDIINAVGQVVKTEMVGNATESFTKEFDVTTLASGTYTIRVKGQNAEANLRLVIAR